MKSIILPTIILSGLTLAGSAQALDLTFTGLSLPDAKTASISVNGGAFSSVYAGQLNFSSANGTLSSYCADALSPLNSAKNPYAVSSLNLDIQTNLGKAGTIISNSQASALTAAQQAGLQLAVWEAIYDGGTTFDANSACFRATNVSDEILGYASQYYGTYCNTPSNGVTYFATNQPGGQSQLTAVPEPMTMTALGVGSLALLRRRRKSA